MRRHVCGRSSFGMSGGGGDCRVAVLAAGSQVKVPERISNSQVLPGGLGHLLFAFIVSGLGSKGVP